MKPFNYFDPVVCPDGCVKPLSEFAGGGSGGGAGGAVDCMAEVTNLVGSGEIISAKRISHGGGCHTYYIRFVPTGNLGTYKKLVGGLKGGGVCVVCDVEPNNPGGFGAATHNPISLNGEVRTQDTLTGTDGRHWYIIANTFEI